MKLIVVDKKQTANKMYGSRLRKIQQREIHETRLDISNTCRHTDEAHKQEMKMNWQLKEGKSHQLKKPEAHRTGGTNHSNYIGNITNNSHKLCTLTLSLLLRLPSLSDIVVSI